MRYLSDPTNPQGNSKTNPLLESLKVFVVVVLVMGGQGAVQAYSSVIDWSKVNDAGMLFSLLVTAYHGFLAGLINGTARSIQIVMAIWAGPTVWKYAAPVVGATLTVMSRGMSNLTALFKRTKPASNDASQH